MIASLSRVGPPDESRIRRALATVPYPVPDVTLRRVGDAVIGIATRPEFVDEWISAPGDMVAAVTGVVENAEELARLLSAAGVPPVSPAPADVVVAAFKHFGHDAPRHLRGPFAGVVSDGRTLWAFRDHVGFRAMFYRADAQGAVAAGEPRQVAVATDLREEPDLEVLEQMLYGEMPSDMPAALKGVSRLAQGTTLIAARGASPTVRRYWNPGALLETARLSEGDVRDGFLALLKQASERSLSGNDLLLLSGGLDSPAVAAYAAPAYRRRTGRAMPGLTAVFPDLPAVDEIKYTQLVADRLGMELHTFRPSARALDDVDAWCQRFASPVPILSIPEVSHAYSLSRSLGADNVITGEFAEFTYGTPAHAFQHVLTHGRLRSLVAYARSERRRGITARSVANRLVATFVPGGLANRFVHWKGWDEPQRIPDWLDWATFNRIPYRNDLTPPPWKRWARLQESGTYGATVMAEADATCATMAGVRVRRPFADVDLWEFFLSLPLERKFPVLEYKALARQALRGVVPDEIVDRTDKTAFDSHVLTQVDYPTLERLLVRPKYRIRGVKYERLAERIAQRDFKRFDWFWAKDLAWIHAFLGAW